MQAIIVVSAVKEATKLISASRRDILLTGIGREIKKIVGKE